MRLAGHVMVGTMSLNRQCWANGLLQDKENQLTIEISVLMKKVFNVMDEIIFMQGRHT